MLKEPSIAETLEGAVALIGEAVRSADTVLLGESTHGTLEFYLLRAALSKYLIESHGFEAVMWEADCSSTPRIDSYVRGGGNYHDPVTALDDFVRFPRWMWRNRPVVDFIRWLRRHNDQMGEGRRIGVYGMDLFSLHSSMDLVLRYLERQGGRAFEKARAAYGRFDEYRDDPHQYGRAGVGRWEGTAQAMVEIASEIAAMEWSAEWPDALLNAKLVQAVEEYYREVYVNPHRAWNVREGFMMECVRVVRRELIRQGRPPKILVWCHNSHAGDGREINTSGGVREVTLGELCRKEPEMRPLSIGFTTHAGEVTAAERWNERGLVQALRPSRAGSWEYLFHRMGKPFLAMQYRNSDLAKEWSGHCRSWRSVGAVYKPHKEWTNHYSVCNLTQQFDIMIFIDRTSALEPLDELGALYPGEPQTFPSGV